MMPHSDIAVAAQPAPAAPRRRVGRPAGAKNKQPAEIKQFAARYGRKAIRELARLAFTKTGDTVTEKQLRVRCMEILIERGFGKPVSPQEITGKDGAPLAVSLLDWLRGLPQ